MNASQWGAISPPEPMPMGGKGLRDVGFVGGGSSSSGRQITKNPLNMMGGMGSSSNGSYSNGSFGGSGGNNGGGFGDQRPISGGGNGFGDRMGGSSSIGNGSGFNSLGLGSGSGGSMMSKMPMSNNNGSSSNNSNGTGYTTDGYGMGAMGSSTARNQGRGSPGSSYSNGYSNGSSSNMFNGMREGGNSRNSGMMSSRDMMGSNSDMNMDRGGMMGMGIGRDMMRGMNGMMDGGGGGGGGRDLMRSQSEIVGLRDMDMMEKRERMERFARTEMMMGGGRGDMLGGRNDFGGSRMMDMDKSRSDMMGSRGEMMGSRSDMMGSRGDMMGSRGDMMGSRGDIMGSSRQDYMGGRMNDMDSRDRGYTGRDMMSMGQRSMSLSNGGGFNNGMGGMGGSGNNGMNSQQGMFNRSMSYQAGGPPSPPGADLKIGTWNEGGSSGGMGGGNGGGGNTGGSGGFPPVPTFEIGTFNVNDPGSRSFGNNYAHMNGGSGGGGNGTTQSNNGPIQPGMGIRETGIIEKLLHSYGFIQCCDRQARLFFHFSQFDGNIEHLKIGDPVEFEMTYDRRTGKPIASAVSKIAPEVVMSEERVMGTVTTEVKISADGNETQGRISYENRGECFFLPFNCSDVEGNVTLASGDKVSFQMATVQRSGNLAAKTIRLENPAAPVKYQGVVNNLKDTYGFIERADVVKEIFFHISEVVDGREEDNSHIRLGDDVEFIIQTRNGKEVACNLLKLPPGTVVFEDVGTEYFTGQVLKPLDRTGKYQQTDALPGRVKYRAADRSEDEVQFGEKDQLGDFTLRHGDWVKFIIATDRRDKLKRATRIELLDESFKVSDERREQGLIQSMKEGFGFLKCVDRSEKMFFHFSECLDVMLELAIGDEVEFTVAPDPAQLGRQLATRIKHLATGTIKFDIVIAQNILGLVADEPLSCVSGWSPRSPTKGLESSVKEGAGRIVYELNGLQLSIPLYAVDCDLRNYPKVGDKVQFNINQLKSTKETNAVDVRILERAEPVEPVLSSSPSSAGDLTSNSSMSIPSFPSTPPKEKEKEKKGERLGSPQKGYVAALKDGFGFIETLQHDKEIFFHFSNVEGKAEKLEVGQEVEYSIYSREKGGKVSAEGVKPLSKGSIPNAPCKEEVLNGKVVRPLRSVNPDQADYCGLIAVKNEEGKQIGEYLFGIASLLNKKELLQEGDPVNFQVSLSEQFALNVKSNKQKLRSNVEAVKGQFGFLSFEKEEGKKLFFHMSEVEGGEILQVGDEVEFVVVTNQRTRKHSACCVRKLGVSKRPERLISKLKTMNNEEVARGGPRIIVVRQPRGPDGKGFKPRGKQEPEKEIIVDLMEQLTAQ